MSASSNAQIFENALASLTPFANRAPHITRQERDERIAKLQKSMQNQGVDAVVLVAKGANLQYFTGIPWQMLERMVGTIVTADKRITICPKFEDTSLAPVMKIESEVAYWEEDEDPASLVSSILQDCGAKSIAVDPASPLWLFDRLQKSAPNLSWSSAGYLIDPMRACKSDTELALLQEAKDMTLKVHEVTASIATPGMKASEIIKFIDMAHRQMAADGGNTFCAVQFGEATSHPHGIPGDQVLQENDLVLIDTGCAVDGYKSDITRTYSIGTVSDKIHDLWKVEKEAQQAAFDAAKIGVPCEEVDNAARRVLEQYDLGPDYILPGLPHRTGHGIGLEIHEGPYLVRGDKTALAKGMCFSNEPMIVVPNEFGIRLEDHFFMTETGAQWFTQPQNSLTQPFA